MLIVLPFLPVAVTRGRCASRLHSESSFACAASASSACRGPDFLLRRGGALLGAR